MDKEDAASAADKVRRMRRFPFQVQSWQYTALDTGCDTRRYNTIKSRPPALHARWRRVSYSTNSNSKFSIRMRYLGIDNLLREAGVKDGDTVRIENFEFEFVE